MANVVYNNFVLGKEIENQLLSHINHAGLCTVDNSLVGTEGMKKIINKYTATGSAEILAQGQGNTTDIGVSFVPKEYEIKLAQTRFPYFDEEAMKDTTAVATGLQMTGNTIYNTVNSAIVDELKTATLTADTTNGVFAGFADAVAAMTFDDIGDNDPAQVSPLVYALVNKADVAKIRKALKDELKYVESFVRTGYVGTVAGVSIYTDNLVDVGEAYVATAKAVTLFNKSGVEVETDREVNTRKNINYARKYFIAALTDEKQAVKLTIA